MSNKRKPTKQKRDFRRDAFFEEMRARANARKTDKTMKKRCYRVAVSAK